MPLEDSGLEVLIEARHTTPKSKRRQNDVSRRYFTPRMAHVDEPYPINGIAFSPLFDPLTIDLFAPPNIIIYERMNLFGFIGYQRMAGTGFMLLTEHFSNRTMHRVLRQRNEFSSQKLPFTFNNDTETFIAYIAYCIGNGEWNTRVQRRHKSIHSLPPGEAYDRANWFLRQVCNWFGTLHAGYGDPDQTLILNYDKIRKIDIKVSFFDRIMRRLQEGGIFSAAKIQSDINANRVLNRLDAAGLLYQNAILFTKITNKFDTEIQKHWRWNLLRQQEIDLTAELPRKLFL